MFKLCRIRVLLALVKGFNLFSFTLAVNEGPCIVGKLVGVGAFIKEINFFVPLVCIAGVSRIARNHF